MDKGVVVFKQSGKADSEVAGLEPTVGGDPHSGMSTEDLHLTLRLKEFDIQAMHLLIRALELERRRLPAASTRASLQPSSCFTAPVAFGIAKDIKLVPPFREAKADYRLVKWWIRLEEFMKCLPEQVVVYLNKQKVTLLTKAAVLVDEFTLTHKAVFFSAVSSVTHVRWWVNQIRLSHWLFYTLFQ